jgi:hypothetical protein
MKKHLDPAAEAPGTESQLDAADLRSTEALPHRLMTALEVAAFVGCHEESVRRAYLSGQLRRQRFGVRNCRFHPRDVVEWIARGAPTTIGRRRGRRAASASAREGRSET